MPTRRIVYFLFLLSAAAFALFYDSWISIVLFTAVLGLPLLSFLLSLPFARRLAVTIDAPESVPRGEHAVIRASFLSRERMCILPGEIRVALFDRMDDAKKTMRFRTPPSGEIPFTAAHCGVWQIEVTRARVYDFLGLFLFSAAGATPARIAVMLIAAPPEVLPDFTALRAVSTRPKPGGGFSEIHELREYRPGDPMRTVHWKVSAKTDDLIVREAQEALNRRALVSYTMSAGRDDADRTLDSLLWVSSELLRMEIPHTVFGRHNGDAARIECASDLDALFLRLLAEPLPASNEDHPLPAADWHFRLEC